MRKLTGYLIVSITLAFTGFWAATQVDVTTFSPGDLIRAEEVNLNFQRLVQALDGKQERIAESCGEGAFIRSVNDDGSVECATGNGEQVSPSVAPLASVRNALQQSIPTNDETLVTFDETELERGGDLFTSAQPSRLTAPEDGIYEIDVQVTWRNEPASGFLASRLYVNANGECSGTGTDNEARAVSEVDVNRPAIHHLGLLKRLEQGDHVELCVVQGTGDEKFVEGFGQTWATMRRVAPAD